MSCEKHKRYIEGFDGSLNELADKIGNLHYESLAEFLIALASKIGDDSLNDYSRDRKKLGDALGKATLKLAHSAVYIQEAFKISEPFMNN